MGYYMITGPGRCGTLWTATALSQFGGVDAIHDPFFAQHFERDAARLLHSPAAKVVAVGCAAHVWAAELHELFRPQWAYLWREPLALVRSHVELTRQHQRNSGLENPKPYEREIRMAAQSLFSNLEASLQILRRRSIPVRHFRLERITTPDGFRELLAWLGIEDREFTLPPPQNAMPAHDRLPGPEAWSAATMASVLEVVESLPLISQVYGQ